MQGVTVLPFPDLSSFAWFGRTLCLRGEGPGLWSDRAGLGEEAVVGGP